MIVVSRFRSLYITKMTFFFCLFLAGMFFCFINAFENGALNFKSNSFFFGIIALLFFVFILFELCILSKIKVTENGIENQTVLFNKITIITFSEIKNIKHTIERSSSEAGYINDGYPVSSVNLKNGSELLISSDCYENYNEIMIAIKKWCEN